MRPHREESTFFTPSALRRGNPPVGTTHAYQDRQREREREKEREREREREREGNRCAMDGMVRSLPRARTAETLRHSLTLYSTA